MINEGKALVGMGFSFSGIKRLLSRTKTDMHIQCINALYMYKHFQENVCQKI